MKTRLLQTYAPDMVNPMPACTILQCEGDIPKNKLLEHNNIKLTPTHSLSTSPLSLTQNTLDPNRPSFTLKSQAPLSTLNLNTLTLYIHAEHSPAIRMRQALLNCLYPITLQFNQHYQINSPLMFKPLPLKPLRPKAAYSLLGSPILTEYSAFPQAMQRISLAGFEKITFPAKCTECTLAIEGEFPHQEDLQLLTHCVPAINLFESTAEPMQLAPDTLSAEFQPDVNLQTGEHCYQIQQADLIRPWGGGTQTIPNWQQARLFDKPQAYYELKDFQQDRFRFFLRHTNVEPPATVSLRLLAHQANQPGQLKPGTEFKNNEQTATSLIRPSKYLKPPKNDESLIFLNLMGTQLYTLTDRQLLQNLIRSLNWGKDEGITMATDSIIQVDAKPYCTVQKGKPVCGVHIELEVSDLIQGTMAYELIHHLLSTHAPLTHQVVTTVRVRDDEVLRYVGNGEGRIL